MKPIQIELPRVTFDTLTIGVSQNTPDEKVVTMFIRDSRVALTTNEQADQAIAALIKAREEIWGKP